MIASSAFAQLVDITDDGGVISGQYNNSPANEGIDKLIDNSTSSKHVILANASWIQYKATQSYIVTKYSITSGNDAPARDPKNWTLYGSSDGLNFVVIDQRSNENWSTRRQTRTFEFSNIAKFRTYKLDMVNHGVDEYGTDILQMAELKIYGTAQGGAFPAADFSASTTFAEPGQEIRFTNRSTNATSYQWDFGNDQSSTELNPTISYAAKGDYVVTLTAFNGTELDKKTATISVYDLSDWSGFQVPEVELINQAGNHQGVQVYTDLCLANGFDSIEGFVQHRCKMVAEKLYFGVPTANAHNVKKITYKLTNGGALSAKSGAPPHITISFDVNYIVSFSQTHGSQKATDEVSGVLCHELTHAYQKEPKNAGGYVDGSEAYGFIEGAADLGRLLTGGFNPPRAPKRGGAWKSGYTTTAFFYLWISKYYGRPDFLKELNKTAEEYSTWSMNLVCTNLLNKSISTVWDKYQSDIVNYPWNYGTKISDNYHRSQETPNGFTLSEAYPNPFNPTTNIRLELPNNQNVSAKIYNALGQHILTLADKKLAAGSMQFAVHAQNWSSGIYYLKVIAGGFTETRKLLLIR